MTFLIGITYSVVFAFLNSVAFYRLIVKNINSHDVQTHAPIKSIISFMISIFALTGSLYVTNFILNPYGQWSDLWSYIIICIIGITTTHICNWFLKFLYKEKQDNTKEIEQENIRDIKATMFFCMPDFCINGIFSWS